MKIISLAFALPTSTCVKPIITLLLKNTEESSVLHCSRKSKDIVHHGLPTREVKLNSFRGR
jgi:hypothetical protein